MVNALLGLKLGMTQIYDEAGRFRGVTVLQVGPCYVTQVKSADKDGYEAVQIGFGSKKPKRTKKAEVGHLKKAGIDPVRFLREVRLAGKDAPEPGEELKVDVFAEGELVDVVGTTKGRGFTGVLKRWGFGGGPGSHGGKTHRGGGSIGPGTYPGRVIKGRKMAGHHGASRRTVKNLRIVKIDAERNLMLVEGGVPGHKNAVLLVRRASSPPASYRKAQLQK